MSRDENVVIALWHRIWIDASVCLFWPVNLWD